MEGPGFISTMMSLPTPTSVLRRIAAVVTSPSSTIDEIVEALKLDPSVTGKMLRLANSACSGISPSIASLRNAVSLLGIKRVQSIIVASRLVEPLGEKHALAPLVLERFWRHSTMVALIAESIGRHCKRYETIDEQELFSAAVLHDIGKLALAVHEPSSLEKTLRRCIGEDVPFYGAEPEAMSHRTVGVELALHWNLPSEIAGAIAHHHAPECAKNHARIVAVVHLSDIMAHLMGYPTFETEMTPPLSDKALAAINLPLERLRIIAETEIEHLSRIEVACGIQGAEANE